MEQIVYFVTKHENILHVIRESLTQCERKQVAIFFDLDGSKYLDVTIAEQLSTEFRIELEHLFAKIQITSIQLFACHMNVMELHGVVFPEFVSSAGVTLFLDYACSAKAVYTF